MSQVSIPQSSTDSAGMLSVMLVTILESYAIPDNAKRIAINLKQHSSKIALQPVEIQLERSQSNNPWKLRFIATFDVVNGPESKKELCLYFNFANGWFYHPDTRECPLTHPEVQSLFQVWVTSFCRHLTDHQLNNVQLTTIKQF